MSRIQRTAKLHTAPLANTSRRCPSTRMLQALQVWGRCGGELPVWAKPASSTVPHRATRSQLGAVGAHGILVVHRRRLQSCYVSFQTMPRDLTYQTGGRTATERPEPEGEATGTATAHQTATSRMATTGKAHAERGGGPSNYARALCENMRCTHECRKAEGGEWVGTLPRQGPCTETCAVHVNISKAEKRGPRSLHKGPVVYLHLLY